MSAMPLCRFCAAPLSQTFIDLGMSPLSNAFIPVAKAGEAEIFYPLHVQACEVCHLVQLPAFESPDAIFGDYLYFSSFSDTWLQHAKAYADEMIARFALGAQSQVVEIASNDGYLLRYFKERAIPVLGVEPAANVAKTAIDRGIATEVAFFGEKTALRLKQAGLAPDLMAANNVLAHVPDLNNFVRGFKLLLKPGGVLTLEFPHLLRLVEENQFDTIYHEHFSYFSLLCVDRVFAQHGMRIFDVRELSTHGGSLRIFVAHDDATMYKRMPAVDAILRREADAELNSSEGYRRFRDNVVRVKSDLLAFCIAAHREGKRIAGYGAPAKGNTLLNYCGIGPEFIEFTVDRNPRKQNMLLPGVRIPVRAPEALLAERPDYVLILPWNLQGEIMQQMAAIRDWGGRFVVPIPELRLI